MQRKGSRRESSRSETLANSYEKKTLYVFKLICLTRIQPGEPEPRGAATFMDCNISADLKNNILSSTL
jgi:hypothetical protein